MCSRNFDVPPVPIKDIDSAEIQGYARFATERHNEITGDKLQFQRAINGLEQGRSYSILQSTGSVTTHGIWTCSS
uniref:Cystatin n=1 Tax=Cucumis sativus TaxID=3659 RepID=A0A0A0KNH4_CUCSA